MDKTRQVISFRGRVADDIANNVLPAAGKINLADNLFQYFRAHSDELVCGMEADMIVVSRRADC